MVIMVRKPRAKDRAGNVTREQLKRSIAQIERMAGELAAVVASMDQNAIADLYVDGLSLFERGMADVTKYVGKVAAAANTSRLRGLGLE